jgi:hypothetical protein
MATFPAKIDARPFMILGALSLSLAQTPTPAPARRRPLTWPLTLGPLQPAFSLRRSLILHIVVAVRDVVITDLKHVSSPLVWTPELAYSRVSTSRFHDCMHGHRFTAEGIGA